MAITARKQTGAQNQRITEMCMGESEKNDLVVILRAVVTTNPNATTAENMLLALTDSVVHAASGGQPRA